MENRKSNELTHLPQGTCLGSGSNRVTAVTGSSHVWRGSSLPLCVMGLLPPTYIKVFSRMELWAGGATCSFTFPFLCPPLPPPFLRSSSPVQTQWSCLPRARPPLCASGPSVPALSVSVSHLAPGDIQVLVISASQASIVG